MHQIKVMLAGLRIYCRACLDRNEKIDPESSSPGILNEVHGLVQNITVETLKIEIDEINKSNNDFKTEILETLKAFGIDMKKGEEQIIEQLRDPGPGSNTDQGDSRDENVGSKDSPYKRRTGATENEIQENIDFVGLKNTVFDRGGDGQKGGSGTTNGALPPLRMMESRPELKTE